MIYFIEFKMNSQTSILVQINKILNIFENEAGRAVIVQSDNENFSVNHTMAEVKNMLTYYNDIKIAESSTH